MKNQPKEPLISTEFESTNAFGTFGESKFTLDDSGDTAQVKPKVSRRVSRTGSVMAEINIVINLHINDSEHGEPFHIFFEQKISGIDTAELVICASIQELNRRLEDQEYPYRLETNPALYSLKIAKKNGKPKSDYPELDRDIKLISVNFTKFALIPQLEAVLRLNDKGEPISSLAGPDKYKRQQSGASKRESNLSNRNSDGHAKIEVMDHEEPEKPKKKCRCAIF